MRSPQPGEGFWKKKGQLEEAKVLNYRSYKGGKIIRKIFLELTKTSNVRPKEISAVAEELEEQEFKESDNQGKHKEVFGIGEYLYMERFDKVVITSLIEGAKVIGKERLEVFWKHQNVCEKFLSEI